MLKMARKSGKMIKNGFEQRTRVNEQESLAGESVIRKLRSSKRWQNLREGILFQSPVCYLCRRIGCVPRPAVDIHHIIPARIIVGREGDEGFFRRDNLVPLCRMHHDRNEDAWRYGVADNLFDKEEFTWLG